MRKGKRVEIWLTDEEKRLLDSKKKRTLREHLLSDVGIEAEPRLRGRPQIESDATKNVMRLYDKFAEDNRRKIHDELVRANRRGLSRDVMRRMIGRDEWVFRDEICKNCGFEYRTAIPTESKCPSCGRMNKKVRPPTEQELGDPVFLNKFEYGESTSVEESTRGNLSTGYVPYENPGSNNEIMKGGVGDRAVTGEDHSRFKFGKKKKAG